MAERWLVTGARGQLGTDLVRQLEADADAEVLGLGSAQLDVRDSSAVEAAVARFAPDIVVNAAAYTAVDAAETDADAAFALNAGAPAVLAAAAERHGARLLHVSTDYVFDGTAQRPYEIDDATAPTSVYGRTKLAGEQAVRALHPDGGFVVRTAWVYGLTGKNFVRTMVRLEGERDTVSVVDDQRGSPTWSNHLAAGLIELGRSGRPAGTFHCTGGGATTWYGLARAVFEELGADPDRVQSTTSAAYPSPVQRPANSELSDRDWVAAGLTPLAPWRDALREAFAVSPHAFRD